MEFYERIKSLAKEKGLSVCGLCKSAGVPTSVLYDMKSGRKHGLSRNTAEKLANVLSVSVDELYGKEKSPEAGASREQKYEIIFNLLSGLSVENTELALKGIHYLVAIPDDKLPEAVRYLQFLANSAEN